MNLKNKQEILANTCKTFLQTIGEDTNRDGLKDTPERFARGYLEMFYGLQYKEEEFLKPLYEKVFTTKNDSMIVLSNIPIYSFCEHHLVPFFGTCNLAYIPNGKVIGLSKLIRIVDYYARRPQIQEQLTEQIAQSIQKYLNTSGVIVTMKCMHLCMWYRGVKEKTFATTSKVLGAFADDMNARQEFYQLSGSLKVF